MKQLPKALRYAPRAFYVVAVIVWVYNAWANWWMLNHTPESPSLDADRLGQLASIIRSQYFVTGFIEAAFMAANGVIVHVLIAIYDRLGVAKEAAE